MRSMRAPLMPFEVNSTTADSRMTARVRSGSRTLELRRRMAGLLTRASIGVFPDSDSNRCPLFRLGLLAHEIAAADHGEIRHGVVEQEQGRGIGAFGLA